MSKGVRSNQGLAQQILPRGGIYQGHPTCVCVCMHHSLCCITVISCIVSKGKEHYKHWPCLFFIVPKENEEQSPSCRAACTKTQKDKPHCCCNCLFVNGQATEAEPQIIIMRENEIHICRKEEEKKQEEEIKWRHWKKGLLKIHRGEKKWENIKGRGWEKSEKDSSASLICLGDIHQSDRAGGVDGVRQ